MSIVEVELVRKRLYETLRSKLLALKLQDVNGRLLNLKENSNLMLRYLFNKLITKTASDDPVFVSTISPIAHKQIEDDFSYHQIINPRASTLIGLLDQGFVLAAQELKEAKLAQDGKIILDGDFDRLIYQGISYPDISQLARKNPELSQYALALNIRYTYLRLLTHGLANNYRSWGYLPETAIEGFASAFNHYFDKYYSAFPDLEQVFGSQGSFFASQDFTGSPIMVNPPFDVQLILRAIKKILEALEKAQDQGIVQSFLLTLPAWTDLEAFMALKTHPYTIKFELIPKEQTDFFDHMRGISIQSSAILRVEMRVPRHSTGIENLDP